MRPLMVSLWARSFPPKRRCDTFFMTERPRKSNNRSHEPPLFSRGAGGKSPRRRRGGEPILFEPVVQLPPLIEGEVSGQSSPAPPESHLEGAQSDAPDSQSGEAALGTRVMKGVSWTLAG